MTEVHVKATSPKTKYIIKVPERWSSWDADAMIAKLNTWAETGNDDLFIHMPDTCELVSVQMPVTFGGVTKDEVENGWAEDPDHLSIVMQDPLNITQIQLPATFRLDTEDSDGG